MRLEKRLLSTTDDEVSTDVDGSKDYDVVIVGKDHSFTLNAHLFAYVIKSR